MAQLKKFCWQKPRQRKCIKNIPCSFKRLIVGLPAEREWTFLHSKERPDIRKFSKTLFFVNTNKLTAAWEENNLYCIFYQEKNLETYIYIWIILATVKIQQQHSKDRTQKTTVFKCKHRENSIIKPQTGDWQDTNASLIHLRKVLWALINYKSWEIFPHVTEI